MSSDERKVYFKEVISDIMVAMPELLSIIRRAIEVEEGGKREWSILDIRAAPSRLRPLLNNGLIQKVSPHTYRLADRDAIKAALEELGAMPRPRRGPGFNVDMSVFEGIEDYEKVKRTIIMALRARAPVHVLLIGPPGVGKSLFLDSVREHLENNNECVGHVEGGKGLTTSVGLVEVVLQFPPDTPCLLTIDELDKLPNQEMAALYRLMTTGEIVLAKHKRIIREKRLVWVLAASNREKVLPDPIKSRFLIVRFRALTEEEYKSIVPGILVKREGVEPELARYIAERLAPITRDPRDAIKIARMAWTKDDVDWLVSQLYSGPRMGGWGQPKPRKT